MTISDLTDQMQFAWCCVVCGKRTPDPAWEIPGGGRACRGCFNQAWEKLMERLKEGDADS